MEWTKSRVIGMTIIMAMAAIIGWSVAVGNVIVPVVAVVVGMSLFHFIRSRVTEVIEDERTHRISEKASVITIRIFALATALTGVLLLALSRSSMVNFEQAGLTLAFTACALMLLHLIFYGYYNKKYGD